MKIMITGAHGQLGTDCNHVLRGIYEVTAVDRSGLDITNLFDVDMWVKQYSPSVIINCAAYTNVDQSETEKAFAWKVNVSGAENLALSVEKYGGRLIHISTDYVFDGRKSVPQGYVETDIPNPISYYGVTKLEGEKAIKRITDRYMVIRTSWMYGINGHNFLKTILKIALKKSDDEIRVVNDQFGSPTWSYRLARQIKKLVDTDDRGIFHASAEGCCTWYELADYFLNKMGIPHRVVPCTSLEYPTPAARPRNSVLENRNLKEKNMNIMANWRTDIDEFISNFREYLLKEMKKE